MRLKILALNIANPSAARAERQLAWLSQRSDHVLVLSETSVSSGSQLILERLATTGWEVRARTTTDGERGVAIASRIRVGAKGPDVVDFLPSRAEVVSIPSLDIIGLYVPSRDDSRDKIDRKRRFCAALSRFLATRAAGQAVVIGDLNVLEPVHRPHYAGFRDWEYRLYDEFLVRGFVDAYRLRHPWEVEHSWFDFESRGYRFDHAFVTESLAGSVRDCGYDHEPREAELSDHSALVLELDWPHAVDELELTGSLATDPLALF